MRLIAFFVCFFNVLVLFHTDVTVAVDWALK